MKLYHVSTWKDLRDMQEGDSFTLLPGTQGAEGRGVYFSCGEERFSAADAVASGRGDISVVVVISGDKNDRRWWRSKKSLCRKHGRAVTWHSNGFSVFCTVLQRDFVQGVVQLACAGKLT